MATANLYDTTGKKLKPATLPKEVFAVEVNPTLVTQAIHVYRTNQSQHTSKTKTRGEINLTKAKWFRQKGTGRARHGAQSAPIFVGGGVAHGPKGIAPRNRKLNKKMRLASLRSVLTQLANDKKITIISGLDKLDAKTSKLDSLLTKLELNHKTLLLTDKPTTNLKKASNNLNYLQINHTTLTNIYNLLTAKHLLIDQDSLNTLKAWLTGQEIKKESK